MVARGGVGVRGVVRGEVWVCGEARGGEGGWVGVGIGMGIGGRGGCGAVVETPDVEDDGAPGGDFIRGDGVVYKGVKNRQLLLLLLLLLPFFDEGRGVGRQGS